MTPLALTALCFGPALASEEPYPKRRPGLWEVRIAGSDAVGMPPAQFCVGEQTDTADMHLDRAIGARGSCTLGGFTPAGEAWVAESACTEGRHTVTKQSIATGDFQTEYRIDTVVTQPARGGTQREDREAVVARWIGPCESGQRPGDLVIPGMGTLNMDDGNFEAEPPSPGGAAAVRKAPRGPSQPPPDPGRR
jgi:hypothetical protein